MLNDVYSAADQKQTTLLVLLDLSAAFDCIDIPTLLRRLEHTFGVSNVPLRWLTSYLDGRSQFVRLGTARSDTMHNDYGVPQGSVLGPLLFTLYVAPVTGIIQELGLNLVQYADDTQIYMHMKSGETNVNSLEYCFNSVRQWFLLNGLQLNPDKSEAIQLGTAAKLRSGYRVSDISLGDHRLTLSSSVKTLGVQIDRALSFTEHVDTVCKSSRFHINALRHIRNCVDLETAKDIASSIVGSRIDYCNSLLYGISNANQHKLQLLQTRWLESSHVPGNMITLRRSYVTFTGCRSPRASIIRLQCLLTSSCPPTHRLICRKSSRFIILHDSCVQPLTARSLSPTLEHSSAQGLFDTLHRQYGTAFLHRSPPRHRLWLHLSVI